MSKRAGRPGASAVPYRQGASPRRRGRKLVGNLLDAWKDDLGDLDLDLAFLDDAA